MAVEIINCGADLFKATPGKHTNISGLLSVGIHNLLSYEMQNLLVKQVSTSQCPVL